MNLQELKPGEKILSSNHTYEIKEVLHRDKENGIFVFRVMDNNKEIKVLKSFEGVPRCDNGRNKHNHYGKRRDGSQKVFDEIQNKAEGYDFLVKHFENFKYRENYFIAIEYLNGCLLRDYIYNHLTEDLQLKNVVLLLAKTLLKWHNNDFAHGDPHLGNVMVLEQDDSPIQVKLFDYSQIHHPDFQYCQKYNCFEPKRKRTDEDFKKNGNLGKGFLHERLEIEKKTPL
ncbi:lipopolysaccharide core heptose(II) kinase RfaY [Trichormus variabilis]|uniref:Protein kinase domain-containing protein n=1 Tax=Trichormus variabilis SAG 1403-4b TaxID=447716 RepID=A0A3S1C5R8_ANAVA|nr:lipopolysaccharide core heptose(II) kinase RfaY [Trichormus variabilis]MBD2627729.1 hypothetical protein [Trichormus variabilis FACHB-164]RUS97099.1 hypothetical protein DSM107003_18400 [Trichormus variabilis SAG 1403-4b]